MYVDDHLLIEVGQVGIHGQHQTMMAPKLASFFPSRREVTITIQASSYHHIRGGLENSMFIGFNQPILDKFYDQVISFKCDQWRSADDWLLYGVLCSISQP